MADSLNIVTIWVPHERTVIVWMVVRSEARCAVVSSASPERSAVEVIHALTVLGSERNVQLSCGCIFLCDPEPRTVVSIACHVHAIRVFQRDGEQSRDAEWSEGFIVKLN